MSNLARGAAVSIVSLLILIAVLAVSFFATTFLAMIIGGTIGHFTNNAWLMSLGFWDYSPVWLVVLCLKAIF